jgi:hypothetical protein
MMIWDLTNLKPLENDSEPRVEVRPPRPPFAPRSEVSAVDILAGKAIEKRLKLIDMLAAAFLKHTGLHPDDAELVEVREAGKTRWFFRARR